MFFIKTIKNALEERRLRSAKKRILNLTQAAGNIEQETPELEDAAFTRMIQSFSAAIRKGSEKYRKQIAGIQALSQKEIEKIIRKLDKEAQKNPNAIPDVMKACAEINTEAAMDVVAKYMGHTTDTTIQGVNILRLRAQDNDIKRLADFTSKYSTKALHKIAKKTRIAPTIGAIEAIGSPAAVKTLQALEEKHEYDFLRDMILDSLRNLTHADNEDVALAAVGAIGEIGEKNNHLNLKPEAIRIISNAFPHLTMKSYETYERLEKILDKLSSASLSQRDLFMHRDKLEDVGDALKQRAAVDPENGNLFVTYFNATAALSSRSDRVMKDKHAEIDTAWHALEKNEYFLKSCTQQTRAALPDAPKYN